jgi:hypothetical protein
MSNSKTIFTLILAIGIYGTGPILAKTSMFAANSAHAEGIGEDHDSDLGWPDDGKHEDSDDDSGAVGVQPGPIFNEPAAPSQACLEPACKDTQLDATTPPNPATLN